MILKTTEWPKWNSLTVMGTGFLAGFIYLLFLKCNQIVPFGNGTWIMYDLKRQYADYYGYYQSLFQGDNHLFYSFSTALGSGTIGLFTYYLSSPFLLFLAFIPKTKFPLGISVIIGMKLVLAAMIMTVFLLYYLKNEPKKSDVLRRMCALGGGITWAYSGFLIAHSMNMMWMDVIICLPLIIGFLNVLLTNGAKRGYILTLSFCLWCNYYITFQVLLFVGLWTIYKVIVSSNKVNVSPVKYFISSIVRVCYATLLSVCLEAIVLLPTFLSLFNSPKDIGKEGLELTGKNLSLLELLSKLPVFAYDEIQPRFGLPQLYCGILTLVLVSLFLVNKKIPKKERVGMSVLLIIMLLSMAFDLLNLIWHAGMEPSGHPYRQAFLFVFLMILCATRALSTLEDGISYRRIVIANCLVIGVMLCAVHAGQPFDTPDMQKLNYVFLLVMLGLVDSLLCIRMNKKFIIIGSILLIVHVFELFLNANYTYPRIALYSAKANEFVTQVTDTGMAVDAVKQLDHSFYRMETYHPRQQNDGMMHSYNGVTHYSSAGLMYVRDFLEHIGYNDDGLYSSYGADNTVTADCILGIKYLVGAEPDQVRSAYKPLNSCNGYENPYYYGIAAIAKNGGIVAEGTLHSENPFENQNQIITDVLGENLELFSEVELTPIEAFGAEETGIEVTEVESDGIETAGIEITGIEELPESYERYRVRCKRTGDVYFYLEGIGDLAQNLAIYVNGQFVTGYGNLACYKVLHLGYYEENEEFTLVVTGEENSDFGKMRVVTENEAALRQLKERMEQQGLVLVERVSSRTLEFDMPCDGTVLTTIPYEKGWRVMVDSKRVQPQKAYETFLMLSGQKAGAHVKFSYVPDGLYPGCIISFVTVIWLLGIIWVKRRKTETTT